MLISTGMRKQKTTSQKIPLWSLPPSMLQLVKTRMLAMIARTISV
jgi:hypothetical protein